MLYESSKFKYGTYFDSLVIILIYCFNFRCLILDLWSCQLLQPPENFSLCLPQWCFSEMLSLIDNGWELLLFSQHYFSMHFMPNLHPRKSNFKDK